MRRVLQRPGGCGVRRLLLGLARGLPPDRQPVRRPRLLQQPVRRRRLRRQHDRHGRGAGTAVLDPHPLDDGEVRQERLHASRPTTTSARSRPNGCATSSPRTAARWWARSSSRWASRSSARRSRTSRRPSPDFVVTLLVGAAQASYYEQAAAANVNLPMASRSTWARAMSTSASRRPASRTCTSPPTTSRKSTRPRAKAFRREVPRQVPGRALHQPGSRELLHRDEPLQADGGARRHDRPCRPARRNRQGRRLLRRAVGQGLPRPQEPAHVAHDLPRQGRSRPQHHLPDGLGEHRALLAGRGRLRPDQNDPSAQYTPSSPPPKN
jgi:hypothetical protein